MGVPLITLTGDSEVSRLGTSFLSMIGRKNWIATNKVEYIEIAKTLSSDYTELNLIRQSLRKEFYNSSLGNSNNFVNEFQKAMKDMWDNYCFKFKA